MQFDGRTGLVRIRCICETALSGVQRGHTITKSGIKMESGALYYLYRKTLVEFSFYFHKDFGRTVILNATASWIMYNSSSVSRRHFNIILEIQWYENTGIIKHRVRQLELKRRFKCVQKTFEVNRLKCVLSVSVDIFLRRKVQLLQSVSLDFEIFFSDCWTTK